MGGPSWQTFWLPIYSVVQLAGGFAATTALHLVRPDTRKDKDNSSWITQKAYEIEEMFDPEDTSEFLGTFFICLTISLNAMLKNNASAIWSVGSCYMVMTYSLTDVSGAVFNPALTFAYCTRWLDTGRGFESAAEVAAKGGTPEKLCDPKKSWKELVKYSIAQMLGAAAGVGGTILIYMFSGSWPTPSVHPTCGEIWNATAEVMQPDCHTTGQAFFAETFGTFVLCFVVLSILSTAAPLKEYAGFCIGSCIIAAGYSFGSISGGLLNPAVTLANSIGHQFEFLTDANPLLYIAAQCIGGVLSGVVFKYVTHRHEMDDADPSSTEAREGAVPLLATDGETA